MCFGFLFTEAVLEFLIIEFYSISFSVCVGVSVECDFLSDGYIFLPVVAVFAEVYFELSVIG
jgi:hypothetical protein